LCIHPGRYYIEKERKLSSFENGKKVLGGGHSQAVYSGMISIGQQAWIGIGGYVLIVVADDLQQSLLLNIVVAGLVAAIIAVPTAFLLFRLRGSYFSIGTWVIAEVFRLLILSNTTWLGGGSGPGRTLEAANMLGRVLRIQVTCWLAIVVGVSTIALVYVLMGSRTGLGLKALRDSEKAAASLGIDTQRMKFIIFTLCAFGTAIVGAVIYLNVLRITPGASFSVQWSPFMFFIVIIGGIGTVEGPVIGAIIIIFIRQYLANYGEWSLILLGSVAVIMMIIAPQGIWGVLQRRWRLVFFPVQRRLHIP
jgi:branched-chain amino acid transport system permease protein